MVDRAAISPPLIKWPGGKRQLLSALRPLVPTSYGRYIEPFAGGAALFFALQPPCATLADVNPNLIEMYEAVRDDPQKVFDGLRRHTNDEQSYYYTRDDYRPRNRFTRAARFLYLQRLAFNGIYRENLDGKFNVPYGYKTHLQLYSFTELVNASVALKCAKLRTSDFTSTLAEASTGDLVYLDPPYTVSHNNNGFIKYNQHLFSWAQQVELAKLACGLSRSGAHVLVSNAFHIPLLALYAGAFRIFRYRRFSVIASKAINRRHVIEAIMISRFTPLQPEALDGLDEVYQ